MNDVIPHVERSGQRDGKGKTEKDREGEELSSILTRDGQKIPVGGFSRAVATRWNVETKNKRLSARLGSEARARRLVCPARRNFSRSEI